MTRGQIVIIRKKDLFTSIEFNGDMYMPDDHWAGYGQEVVDGLKQVQDLADYFSFVATFNKEHHHYCDLDHLWYNYNETQIKQHHMLDMREDYFENWFSDYLYIKNMSDEKITIMDSDGETLEIEPDKIVVLCFGKFELLF